jgi:hypothetical protein
VNFAAGDLRVEIHTGRCDSCSAREGYHRGHEKIGEGVDRADLTEPTCPATCLLELALPTKMIQRGSESNANKVLAQGGNCSVNLASQGHCAGVFIGA